MLTLLSPRLAEHPQTPSGCSHPESTRLFTSSLIGNQTWIREGQCTENPLRPVVEVHLYPAHVVLGLKRQPDMFTLAENHSFVELEKLIRMALHQSILAFEILTGPAWGDFERLKIIVSSFTNDLVLNMDHLLTKAEENWDYGSPSMHAYQFNLLLSRIALNAGIASIDVPSILETCDFAGKDDIASPSFCPSEHSELFKKLSQEARKSHTPLPTSPKGYQDMSDLLVNLRLK